MNLNSVIKDIILNYKRILKNLIFNARVIYITAINYFGAIAQLVEHLHGMQGVSGSSPLGSIRIFFISIFQHRNYIKKIVY